jgi:aspartate-semialdehyde dehydrogenase
MSYTVGIVGATGAVGKEIRQCLEKSDFPVEKLRIFGSSRSAGSTIRSETFGDITVELFGVDAARECDVVFLAVSGDFALEHAEAISAGDDGAVVIDNSSAFRYKPEIPLVVPEINGQETKKGKLIANPNCTTAIGLMALWPLHKLFGLKKIIMSTYQAASGAGQPGMDELQDGTRVYLEGGTPENSIFAHPLPFNVIPQIDKFQENGYTKEEMKVTWEARKICGLGDDFPVSCTAVRIPTIRAHSESILVETEKPVDIEAARKALDEAPGVKLVDDPDNLQYPMPLTATGAYDVEVGRLRKSLIFGDYGLEFFVSGDQLLRGAALNAVLVAEEMNNNGALKALKKVEA